MRRIRRAVVVGVFALGAAWVPAQSAFAAQPNNQACLGHDFSGYAEAGSGFGGFLSGLASTTQGLHNEVQAHLAGQVPDAVIPNSCNDL